MMKLSNSVDIIKKMKITKDVHEAADLYRILSNLSAAINEKQKELEPLLLENEVYELFPEDQQKVVYAAGKDRTEINKKRLHNFLMKNDREKDFFNITSVSEAAVKKLKDGKELVAKFKQIVGKTSDGIHVKPMTKEEIEKAAEEKGSK
jgi:hypothetical protein